MLPLRLAAKKLSGFNFYYRLVRGYASALTKHLTLQAGGQVIFCEADVCGQDFTFA